MAWKALQPFTGYPTADEKRYMTGDTIPDDEAEAMNLKAKPELAEEVPGVSENP